MPQDPRLREGPLGARPRGSLRGSGGGGSLRNASIDERSQARSPLPGHGTLSTSKVGSWRLAVGGGWQLAVGGGWQRLAVGGCWSLGAVLKGGP